MVSETGRKLISALRKSGSISAVFDTPEEYFLADELQAFRWLKEYIKEHRSFPSAQTVLRHTKVKKTPVPNALTYYVEEARKRAVYNMVRDKYPSLRRSLEANDPDAVLIVAREIANIGNAPYMSKDRQRGVISIDEAVAEVERDYEEAHSLYGLRGITTGWPYVDAIMDGHQKADLNTLVGRPGTGKTWLMLFQAHAAWEAGYSVLFVSMEMSSLQIARRLVGLTSKINPNRIKTGKLDTRVHREVLDSMSYLREGAAFNIIVGNFRKSVDSVRSFAEEFLPDEIFADAGYLLTPEKKRAGSGGRRESVSDVVEELKQVAVHMDRPVVQSVQFNRTAVRPKSVDEDDERRNPIAHLGLHKIGETDVMGQVSSVVIGIEIGDAPYEDIRRWAGFLKGREGESGFWEIKYEFNPVDFSVVPQGLREPLTTNPDMETNE